MFVMIKRRAPGLVYNESDVKSRLFLSFYFVRLYGGMCAYMCVSASGCPFWHLCRIS